MARTASAVLFAFTALFLGCSNAGEDLGFGIVGTGSISVTVFLDRDGSGTSSSVDTVFGGAEVALLVAGTRDTVTTLLSDAVGTVRFTKVALGRYQVVVTSLGLGDTIQPGRSTTDTLPITLTSAFNLGVATVILDFNSATITGVRGLPSGTRILVRGTVTAGQVFGDSTLFLRDSTGTLRVTKTVDVNGGPVRFPGDSVHIVGTVASSNGQAILDSAKVYSLGAGPTPVPDTVTTLEAATAAGGSLDAALIHIVGTSVVDTATVGSNFRARVDDGSGVVDVLIDASVNVNPNVFAAANILDITGVLVPTGSGSWQLKPRGVSDITVN